MKLFALPSLYRQGESHRAAIYESDLAGLLAFQVVDVDSAFRELGSHLLETDLVELRKLVGEIQSRPERFGGSAG